MSSTDDLIALQRARRGKVIQSFEDMLEVSNDLHIILAAVGRDYASLRRSLKGAKRDDLVAKLTAMKEADSERLRYALGRQWQA